MQNRRLLALGALPLTAIVITGCSSADSGGGDQSPGADGVLTVVASTNVYGDIASSVLGDTAEVTSIIDSSAQDPHEYEATAQDQLAISKADIIIENGGGFDPFIDSLISASGNDTAVVLNASELSGLMPGAEEHSHDHEGEDADAAETTETEDAHDHAEEGEDEHEGHDHIEGFNEHVWYSFDAVDNLAHELVHAAGDVDESIADAAHEGYEAFAAKLATLGETADGLSSVADGRDSLATEPVPGYLLERVGLHDVTPADFSEAVEEGDDVPPLALQQTLDLVDSGDLALVATNTQSGGAEADQVVSEAEKAGLPVVPFSETLPEGAGYIEWMTDNLSALDDALQK
ncbi:metal ABC transporter substrate-binding protein [Mycetocola reblochoni]|uniref:Zinc ABC transporter, periplasmic-binding protein ZnuA n=2 Tax=Mycetocola reblochoni TaxID=331618 RepID=A0A1R4JLY3_9MICO|nr:zinc ABC transporter substrate-binding protein [Mycetocola reblochoni]RLP68569.1 metal ABC transporter substrate-binding protein [Mycetocola reblochoni]SJN33050.1 Zinc ABC transporter, periplasmic-binding protein ZnuA [Mycetocola reblochoni REB411]